MRFHFRAVRSALAVLLAATLPWLTGCESSGGGGDSNDFGDRDPTACAVIGDSIAIGYGDAGTPWPARLAAMLGRNVSNHGVGGSPSSGARAILNGVLARDAGFILIATGANDAILGYGADTVRGNLAAMIGDIRAAQAVPVVGNVTQMTEGHAIFNGEVVAINAAIRELCSSEGVLFVDLNKVVSADMLQADGLHPNSEGQEAIAHAFYDKLKNRVH
jgi:acyl-CoA thioesterase-1